MSSKRLPGKALLKLSQGSTILESIIERVQKINLLDHFCVANSKEISDDPIFEKAKERFKGKKVVINLSGRGDKDMIQAINLLNFD